MKFGELKPRMTGGMKPGTAQLVFDCPVCGAPYEIMIYVWPDGREASEGNWQLLMQAPPNFSWDTVTLYPSVNNSNHGRRKSCTAHFNVVNGEVIMT